ncbi:MAG TPA: TrbI/VirB10 family protein, partial [Gammaproteobacteria bacterium]|nr:TrbI/VirB10 family protein [Gammaproteobacteria bacterium]
SALLLSVISAGFEIATNDDEGVDENQQTAREAVARQMSQVAGRVLEKNLNIQPTITIRNGQIGSVMVNKDLYLRPWNPQLASWAPM